MKEKAKYNSISFILSMKVFVFSLFNEVDTQLKGVALV